MANKPDPLVAIARDTNEQTKAWVLKKMAERGEITLINATLNVGDFTVVGHAKRCCIETKWSIADLAGSFTTRRKQFEAMWTRAWEHEMKVLIIVGCWHDLEHENYRAMFPREKFQQTLIQWSIKHEFNYVFVPDVAEGLQRVFLYCLAYQRMFDRGSIGKARQPWHYLLDSAQGAVATSPGTFDTTRSGGHDSPAQEHMAAERQLEMAIPPLVGRRGK